MNNEVMFSSRADDWETPQWLFDQLNAEFGFTLKVTEHVFGQEVAE